MRNLKKKFLAVVLMAVAMTAWAAADDLVNCVYSNGRAMEARVCQALRISADKEAALAARRAQAAASNHALIEQRQQELAAAESERRQKNAEDARRYNEEQAAKKAEAEQYRDDQERKEEQLEAKRRAECGKDYGSPRVGMTFKRAEQCVGDFVMKGQINRPDGVVTTYRSGNGYVYVMNGKIVSWGFYPHR